jgi:hypothetical protein
MTALDWAEEGEHVEIAEMLSTAMSALAQTALPEHDTAAAGAHGEESAFAEANPISEDHMTALIYAAHHGDLVQVRALVAQGSDVNAVDEVHLLQALD